MDKDKLGPIVVSVIATCSFAGILILWFLRPQAASSDVLNVLVGALSAGYLQTLNYWFGSSSGSKQKDDTISKLSAP